MKHKIKVWVTRILSVALLVVAAQHWGLPAYKQYLTPKKTAEYIPSTKALEGKFIISFRQIGTLQAERSVSVDSAINGKIITLIDDGKVVSPGDQLAVMDVTELERQEYNQNLEYENRLADVDRAKAELVLLKEQNRTDQEQQEAQLKFDKNELILAEQDLTKKIALLEEKLITGAQVDQAEGVVRSKELAVTKGEAQLELKIKEIESKENQKDADIRNVKYRADMAKSNLDRTRREMGSAVLTAPAPGLVVIRTTRTSEGRRKLQEGDSVHQRQTICTLPNLSSMQVKVQVGESDAPKLRIDMPALIRLEAVPDKVFHGTVQDISSLATEASPWEGGTPGKKNFEVIIAVEESDPKTLKPGMTADVEFICDSVEKAVYLPIESVVEREGKTYVFVKEGGRYKRTQVTTGKNNDNFICITKGVKKEQVVALRDPTRDLEQQEAGSAFPGKEEKEEEKKPVPIPGAAEE